MWISGPGHALCGGAGVHWSRNGRDDPRDFRANLDCCGLWNGHVVWSARDEQGLTSSPGFWDYAEVSDLIGFTKINKLRHKHLMNPLDNPFAPGAGVPPPELAGRDELLQSIRVAAERTRRRMAARSVLLLGLHGLGKTVVLERVHGDAQGTGLATLMIEANDRSALPAVLAAKLRGVLLRLSRQIRVRDLAERAIRVLVGFASALRVRYGDIELGIHAPAEPGVADSGDLELDLIALFDALGPTRAQLIAKGMIWSAARGDTAFTVPLFDQFMRRIMPDAAWRE